ncbi:MAG: C/D box methylation guide ribonucleoprotein complex aNOP56 subunit [Hadesarchaea archaeon]|nr:C/D box methylation guide ribonucleoprotein complex aNOP56 subunit [Hadesarchaea archaeon]
MNQLTIHIGECPLGVFAFDDNGKMIESEVFPVDAREISSKLINTKNDKPTEEHEEIFKKLYNQGYREFTMTPKGIASQLREKFQDVEIEIEVLNKANKILGDSIPEIASKFGFENPHELIRDANIIIAREELRQEAAERDKIIIETVNTLVELDETINSLYGRIREWYGIHFPELEKHIYEHTQYFKLITELGPRENFTKENLEELEIQEDVAEKISNYTEESVGAEFDEVDINAIQNVVERINNLSETREEIENYLDDLMTQVAPNIQTIVGGTIGARLISLAGSLKKLSRMPSSTIQVLGAEKALFRSLQEGAKPPKHGVIYQYPEIRSAPRKLQGKISRALAGKLSIAARVDALSGKFVGDELKEELEERINAIKSKNGG